MITLNPDFVGTVDRAPKEVIEEERKLAYEASHPGKKYVKKKTRKGKTSARRYAKKQKNVWDEKKAKVAEEIEKKRKDREKLVLEQEGVEEEPSILDRFKKRKLH